MTDTKHLINSVKKLFKDEPVKQKFIDIISSQMSDRTLLSLNKNEFYDFITLLYDYFIIQNNEGKNIYFGEPQLKSSNLTNRLVLKMSQPDAANLFITIEEILRKYHLRSTRRIHPIVGIKRDSKGKIVDIVNPNQSFERRSLIFVAFEQLPDVSTIEKVKADIEFHMNCVQAAQIDSDQIIQKVNFVSKQLQLIKPSISAEWNKLLSWLTDQNFSFFGCQVLERNGKNPTIKESYGICRDDINIETLKQPTEQLLFHPKNTPFLVDRTTIISQIQRFEPLMRVSFKFNTTQYVFYGILKRSSMYAKNIDTPIINKKMEYIFNERHFLPGSYDFNEVIRIFNDIPKFELFRTSQTQLLDMVDFIMSITNLNHIQCYKYYPEKNRLTLYFVIPYFFFSPKTVELITNHITSSLDYSYFDVLPITAPEKCRIHMHFQLKKKDNLPSEEALERTLTTMVLPWEDQVKNILLDQHSDLLEADPYIVKKIPSHYRVRTKPESAVRDILHLTSFKTKEDLHFEFFSFDYPKTSDLAGKASMLLVYYQSKLSLTEILPILHNLGIYVIDQITSRFGDSESTIGYILAFRLLDKSKNKIDESLIKERLINCLKVVFSKELPNDPINQLILTTSLTHNDIFVLQGIRNYLYQIFSSSFSIALINQTVTSHPEFIQSLSNLFSAKFNPDQAKKERLSKIIVITNNLKKYIKSVQNITEDQLLRRLLSVVLACVRTNYFFKAPNDALSFKFDCKEIFGIQTPVPYRETFVFDTALEGVHIRFGAVARGGLRWSDRLDDYRTEVLGLVRTQQTKNAVIIPVGSKGGFVIKKGSPGYDDGVFQYQRFITAMLQLADNLVNGKPHLNSKRVAYDDFDPYFVVAADKGTATFSDFANGVSQSQNFWLGDGFASGGAQGYDHKKVGITAKGAWECTKLHFKSMNQNPETNVVTVAGVGDMSGDVFGNGMLLSKSIKLVAAFNHMHIFIDPNPDPLKSWKERQRLFKKSHSAWTDYKDISVGGGVFERSSKEIICSKEIQQLLNLNQKQVSGEELIQAILKSQVDLLWFGGIGTYIKASSESHIEAGDPSNNSVRVNANDVQSKIIGEGANLAITQKGRIEFELNKGRINTDAIDNSAGVNMSDYEVNIKILLSDLLQKKVIKTDNDRNTILEKATDEVTHLVLQNNISQHNLISLDQYRSKNQPFLVDQSISNLIKLGILNHIDEQIPTSKERQELYRQNIPLPRSVLAKCQAYVKMRIKDALIQSNRFEGHLYDDIYHNYFPDLIRSLVPKKSFPNHRLKKDIIITQLTNHFVGIYGCSGYETLTFSDQIDIDQAIHHLVILEHLFDVPKKRKSVEMKELSEKDRTTTLFQINQSLLYAILFCKLQNLSLNPNEIDAYRLQINEPSIKKLPLQLQCLFLNTKPKRSDNRLFELEKQTSLLTNLKNLEAFNTTSQVMHDQKLSIIADLYTSIIQLIDLEESQFDALINDITSNLNAIPINNDTFSNLFLYSYKLRQFLTRLNK